MILIDYRVIDRLHVEVMAKAAEVAEKQQQQQEHNLAASRGIAAAIACIGPELVNYYRKLGSFDGCSNC